MIIPVTLDKLETLQSLAQITFKQTFKHYTEQDLHDYFENDLSIETLKTELLNPESQHFFIIHDDKEVGFLKVNVGQAQTEQELEKAFEIQRIYILKDYQSKGLGKKLFEYALSLAQQTDLEWIWLGVWEHNTRAQSLYFSYGFEKFSQHDFIVNGKADCDWLLRKKIEH